MPVIYSDANKSIFLIWIIGFSEFFEKLNFWNAIEFEFQTFLFGSLISIMNHDFLEIWAWPKNFYILYKGCDFWLENLHWQ